MHKTQQGNKSVRLLAGLIGVVLYLPTPLLAVVQVQQVTPTPASPQPVGTIITWTANATDSDAGPLLYQFSVKLGKSSNWQIIRDFSLSNSFQYTYSRSEVLYQVQVVARDNVTLAQANLIAPSFLVTSLVPSGNPVVTPTSHPLVALLSVPSCPAGSYMRAIFSKVGTSNPTPNATDWRSCHPPASMNFYIAGMAANLTYNINYQLYTGGQTTTGLQPLQFPTGALPGSVNFPGSIVAIPPSASAAQGLGIVLHDYLNIGSIGGPFPVATTLAGTVIWYYLTAAQTAGQVTRPLYGGTMLLVTHGTSLNPTTQDQIFREIDLAGNTVRETNVSAVSAQLQAMNTDAINSFHHDGIRLPNGYTAVLGSVERLYPPGTQGDTSGNPVDILADMIVVLDQNWQVVWFWNGFENATTGDPHYLDVNRAAVLGETCINGQSGCPPVFLVPEGSIANDWLHSNSIQYVSSDGSIIISHRHQDWVVKIDYGNGLGTKNVLWRLGPGGDFQMNSNDPFPWFSHQHDAGFESPGVMSILDNGNTRVAQTGPANSRGQLLNVDEVGMQVSLQLNADLGVYGFALGSAQLLPNGNAFYQPGTTFPPQQNSYCIEVDSSGNQVYNMRTGPSYRSWRLKNLYQPPLT